MNKIFTPKLILIFVFIIISVFIYWISANHLDNKINDAFIKVFTSIQNKKAPDDVVLVVVDDISIEKIAWPWQRDLFSDIFEFLEKESGAKAIVFQNLILFPDSYNPESDVTFYNSLKNLDRLINSYIFLNSNKAGDVLPSEYLKLFESKTNLTIVDKRTNYIPPSYRGVAKLPKDFLFNVKHLASVILPEDKDDIVRNYMPVVKFKDKLYPSAALSAYAMYTGINSFVLYDNFLCSADNCKTLKMPIVQKKGKDFLGNNFYGIFSNYIWYKPVAPHYTHKKYSAIDVLISYYAIKTGKSPKIPREAFKDKIVIVGLNADENVWEQLSETSILKKQADVDVHATIISNMLSNTFYAVNANDYSIIITLVFCFFIIKGFKRFKNNLIYTLAFSIIYFIYYIFEYLMNTYVPPFTPILLMYMAAIQKNLYVILTSDKNTERIKRAFGKYVSKDVMKKVVSNLDKINPGGIRTTVTILFVDIRNFTQISENLAPQELSAILNEYFATIEPVIEKYHGIVNKYMGDGLLAIFGESVKTSNHALDAVRCGSEIISKVKDLKEKLANEGKPKINVGIGINTGEVFAGNIGTEERLEYTVIGDNVNLAYRIEAYNQLLKTQFLISEYTYKFVKDYADVVKLSQVSIKGKSAPIDIYEILRIKTDER